MRTLVVVLFCALLVVSCEQRVNPDAAISEVKAASAKFAEGVNKMDVDMIMSTYWNNPEIVVWYPNKDLIGYDAVKAYWQEDFANSEVKRFDVTDHNLTMLGAAVHETAFWNYTFQPKGGPEIALSGRADVVWEKKDGKWVITFDHASIVFVPPPMPAE